MENNNSNENLKKKQYVLGEIKEYDLEKIEQEVLKESVYLDVFAGSDLNFKENCQPLNSSDVLMKLKTLNAYTFNYKTKEFPEHQFAEGSQIGFMAHEIESIYPELIMKDSNGNRLVNYTQVIPLMVQSIKELSKTVETLETRLTQLEQNRS